MSSCYNRLKIKSNEKIIQNLIKEKQICDEYKTVVDGITAQDIHRLIFTASIAMFVNETTDSKLIPNMFSANFRQLNHISTNADLFSILFPLKYIKR